MSFGILIEKDLLTMRRCVVRTVVEPNVPNKYINRPTYDFTLFKCPSNTADLDEADFEFSQEGNWIYRNARKPAVYDEACFRVRPTTRDINKRFHAILPYFDKVHSNTEFLHKFRATVHGMSEGEDLLDRETAFYAAVLTPIVFLQN
ncbi:jg17874 [Pararge aegeria aegeria]|uniref:Jg17874 protein n=1 Tax=Pararge aegeria aegeria TaxID=348720 RepID=A0A8S4SR94_9NEOP|nr:jg17874 [Pararge aegeria aegeria]